MADESVIVEDAAQIRMAGELRVATRNSPVSYYIGTQGPEGPEYELAAAFEAEYALAPGRPRKPATLAIPTSVPRRTDFIRAMNGWNV